MGGTRPGFICHCQRQILTHPHRQHEEKDSWKEGKAIKKESNKIFDLPKLKRNIWFAAKLKVNNLKGNKNTWKITKIRIVKHNKSYDQFYE